MKHGYALIADAHPEMLGALPGLLREQFDAVAMVADEASLLATIPRLRPDLVVLDLSLPVSGGRNAAAECGEKFPAVRVIVLGVHDEPQAAAATLRAGARGYVLKRSVATDLTPAVSAVLGGGNYVSARVGPRRSRTGDAP